MFFAPTVQLAKLTLFLRFRKFNLVTNGLRLKIVMFYVRKHIFASFGYSKKVVPLHLENVERFACLQPH